MADGARRRGLLRGLGRVRRRGVSRWARPSRRWRCGSPACPEAVPAAVGAVVVTAGALQLTAMEGAAPGLLPERARARSARSPARRRRRLAPRPAAGAPVRGRCCGNLMVILLLAGVMDLAAMAAVTAAITLERVAPAGQSVARAVGLVAVLTGALLLARAAGLS